MFGLLFVVAVGIFTLWYTQSPNEATRDLPQRLSAKLDKLWEIAQESLKSQRYLRAEKALLTILRIDERYYETENYEKAALAFEQALAMEETVASRHIAYAKVQEKLDHPKRMFEHLERAIELEPSVQSYNILADAYERNGEHEKSGALRTRINRAINSKNPPAARIKQPRRVAM